MEWRRQHPAVRSFYYSREIPRCEGLYCNFTECLRLTPFSQQLRWYFLVSCPCEWNQVYASYRPEFWDVQEVETKRKDKNDRYCKVLYSKPAQETRQKSPHTTGKTKIATLEYTKSTYIHHIFLQKYSQSDRQKEFQYFNLIYF